MLLASPHDPSTVEAVFPRRFGRYVLLSHLGEGGMGRVYLALSRERGVERLTVIKRFGNPRARLTREQIDENQQRFRREAEITMALTHPGIVRTFAHTQAGADSYLVQEFVHGMSLEFLLASMASSRQRFPPLLAAHVVGKLAQALAYLHEFRGLGLVHRDLTPSNVILSQEGEVKIIDFGIAKATATADTVTKPHVLIGKPLWTAPEVLAGAPADRRADLYSLGILFWCLLTGANPESRLAEGESLPPPSSLNPKVPLDLDEVVARAIDAHPNRRFQTAGGFGDAVACLVPFEYAGQPELAQLLARYQPVLEQRFFAEVVDRGRPLLEQIESRRWWRKHPLGTALLGLAALVLLVLLAARPVRQAWVDRHPKPAPASATPLPPPASEANLAAVPSIPVPEPRPPAPVEVPRPAGGAPAAPQVMRVRSSSGAKRGTAAPAATPAQSSPAPPAEELLDAAFEALARSDHAKAVALARASLQQRPTADAYILVGRILFESDPEAAQTALEAAIRLSPSDRQASRLLDALRQRNQ